MKKVFVVDDEFEVLLSLSRWFLSKGWYVRTFSESKPLFDALYESLPDVIVMDMHLQKENGKELCRQIKTKFSSHVPVVMFSALPNTAKDVKDNCADYLITQSSIQQSVLPLLLSFEAAIINN